MLGLKINTKKTKLLTPHENDEDHIEIDGKRDEDHIEIDGKRIEEVKEFCYLGSTLGPQEGTETDIDRRIGVARNVFNTFNEELGLPETSSTHSTGDGH
ncbi:hypothetical protein QE152_g14 [Popillia japonica]|uniref:Reverse transcriptase n=1 Tax=Popillia japonica TaxID=7064 RepID=A0AAW1NDE9_POPJA